jgi:hypothetical protein
MYLAAFEPGTNRFYVQIQLGNSFTCLNYNLALREPSLERVRDNIDNDKLSMCSFQMDTEDCTLACE